MCENCEKQCYQIAYFNDVCKEICKGLCYEQSEECKKIIIIDDVKYCSCNNNPEKIKNKDLNG